MSPISPNLIAMLFLIPLSLFFHLNYLYMEEYLYAERKVHLAVSFRHQLKRQVQVSRFAAETPK